LHVDWGIFTDEVDKKIKYWVDIWSELSNDIENGILGSSIITPHALVTDIQNEITFNKLKNKENKDYFLEKLKLIINKDKVIKANYLNEFSLLKDNLEESNLSYLKIITKDIKEEFAKENYVEHVFSALEKLLLSNKEDDKAYEEIRELSLTLITELITSGNSLSNIKNMAINTFSFYEELDDRIRPLFENHGLRYQDYSNRKSYLSAIKDIIDTLTIEERIQSFKDYLTKKPEERSYIFPVQGLSKVSRSFVLNDVEIYNPLHITKTNTDINDIDRFEVFSRGNVDGRAVNVLVKIKSVDIITGKQKAIEKAESCLDLLRFMYQSDRQQITIDKYTHIVTNAESSIISLSRGRSEAQRKASFTEHNPLDINHLINNEGSLEVIRNVESVLELSDTNPLKRAIINALSWYEKARTTDKVEEKLLNYWISIENLMEFKGNNTNENIFYKEGESKYLLAKKLIPENTALYYVNRLIKDLYSEISSKVWSSDEVFKGIPEDIYEECSFHMLEGRIHLTPFLENLPKLVEYTETKVIIDKLNFVYKFYADNKAAHKELRQKVKEVENDILYIYKYRNQIVHNGHVDQNILPHIVQNARRYATYLITEVISQCNKNEKELMDIMINIDYRYNVLIKDLGNSSKGHIDLLKPR